jgi:hypothetical protein
VLHVAAFPILLTAEFLQVVVEPLFEQLQVVYATLPVVGVQFVLVPQDVGAQLVVP